MNHGRALELVDQAHLPAGHSRAGLVRELVQVVDPGSRLFLAASVGLESQAVGSRGLLQRMHALGRGVEGQIGQAPQDEGVPHLGNQGASGPAASSIRRHRNNAVTSPQRSLLPPTLSLASSALGMDPLVDGEARAPPKAPAWMR